MEVIVVGKNEFTSLVCNYRKSLVIMEFLTHLVGKTSPMDALLRMTEIYKIFGITRQDLREARNSNKLSGVSINNIVHYRAIDIIDLKCRIENKRIKDIVSKVVHDESILKDNIAII